MADIFKAVLDISLAASALALLAMAARLLVGRRPNAVLPLLTALLILRLAVPVAIPSPLSVMNLFRFTRMEQPAAEISGDVNETPGYEFTQPEANPEVNTDTNTSVEIHTPDNQTGPGVNAGVNYTSADKPAVKALSGMEIASLAWIAGMAVMAACVAAGNTRFALALKKNRRYDAPGFAELLEQCKEELGIRKHVEAIQLSGINTAAIYGIRPKLLISPSFGWLSNEEKRHVLLHELSHIKRRDTFVCLLITALSVVYWFNPVLWLAFALARRDMEIMCDAAVIKLTQDKRSYASTLFSLAKASNSSKPRLVSALFIGPQSALRFGVLVSTDSIKRRMKMITRYKRSRLLTAVSIILVLAIAITGCTEAVSKNAGNAPKEAVTTETNFTPPEIEGQKLIASYSLDFSSVAGDEARVANVKKAAEMLDGTVFPHMDVSLTYTENFERHVNVIDLLGPITEEAGWQVAPRSGWELVLKADQWATEKGVKDGVYVNTNAEDFETDVVTAENKRLPGGGAEIAVIAVYKAIQLTDIFERINYYAVEDIGGMNSDYAADMSLKIRVQQNTITAAFYAPADAVIGYSVPEIEGHELIASYSLNFSSIAGDEARVANIKKMANMLDGTVLPHMDDSLSIVEDVQRRIEIPDALGPITEDAGWRNALWTGWDSLDENISGNAIDPTSVYYIDPQGSIAASDIKMKAGGGIEIVAALLYRAAQYAGIDSGANCLHPNNGENGNGVLIVNNQYVSDLVLRMRVENNCVIAAFYMKGAAELLPSSAYNRDYWFIKYADKFTNDGTVQQTENSYKSANINVTIEKVQKDGATYFIADIYLAVPGLFRTAFPVDADTMGGREATDKVANEVNAVLAINGDQCVDNPGIAVRNGEIYREQKSPADIFVMYHEGSMQTFSPDEFNLDKIKGYGVEQAWAFGPMLLKDGQPMTEFNSTVGMASPRTAVGYYEPGHYCFVVVDGRQPGYSNGVTLAQLSQIFYDLGCTAAYNMDGGQTSEMVFMGKLVNHPYEGGRSTTDIIYIGEPIPDNGGVVGE